MKAVAVSTVVAELVKQRQNVVGLHRGGMTFQALPGCTSSLGTAGVSGGSTLEAVAVAASNRHVGMVQVVDGNTVAQTGAKEQQPYQHKDSY